MPRPPVLGAATVAALVYLGIAGSAHAQGNPQSQVLGGRSALMGGTGVALGLDSAAPFLNPATVARIDQSTLALSSQLIEVSYRRISNFRQPAPDSGTGLVIEDADVTDFGVDFIPTAVCYFQNVGEAGAEDRTLAHTLSFCVGATESSDLSSLGEAASVQNDALRVDATSSLRTQWARRAFNLGWGHYFSSWFAGGASIVVEQAEQTLALATTTLFEDRETGIGSENAYSLSRTGSSFSLRGEVGGLIRLARRYHVGLSARTPSWVFASSYSSTELRRGTDGGSRRTVDSGSFEAPGAIRFALGLGYEAPRLQLEINLFFFLPEAGFLELEIDREEATTDSDGRVQRAAQRTRIQDGSNFVVNASVGVRYVLDQKWSVLAGFQTDLSLLDDRRDLAPASRVAASSADAFFGSVGVGYEGRVGKLLSGLRVGYREGEVLAIDGFSNVPTARVVDDRALSVLLVIYGELDFGAVARDLTPAFLKKSDDEDDG